MSEKINLNEIRKRVYLSYTEDGLIDVALGLVITGFAIMLMADQAWMVGLLGVLPLLIWYLGKRSLTIPRIGRIQPDHKAKLQFTGFGIAMFILGIGVLGLFILVGRKGGRFFIEHPLVIFGLILALGISALGFIVKTGRLYIYAILVFVAMAAGDIINQSIKNLDTYLLAVFLAGVIIILTGCCVLAGFMKKYPVVTLDE